MNKKSLAVLLSKISSFKSQNVKLEQYPTDSEIAADFLWYAYQQGDIEGKVIADLGSGHGILGIGALVLGAKKVHFVDLDKDAINVAKKNFEYLKKEMGGKFLAQFHNMHVADFEKKVDVVIQNPPFGVKKSHSDKVFLLKAMDLAPIIYTFHKLSTRNFVNFFVKDNGFKVKTVKKYNFPLKRAFWFHTKKVKHVDVGVWKIERFKKN